MKETTRAIAAAICLGAWVAAAPGQESRTPELGASAVGERWTEARQRARLEALRIADREAIRWGNEHRANRSIVMVLDPPLESRNRDGRVEVELYATSIDDDGTSDVETCARELTLGTWWPSIEQAGLPVSLAHRQVDEGPGLDDRYRAVRQQVSELVTGGAWLAANGDKRGLEVVEATLQRARVGLAEGGLSEEEWRGLLTRADIGPGEWRTRTEGPIQAARAEGSERWKHLAGQYMEKRWPEARRGSPLGTGASPILLVDGRYLVTMNTIRRQGGLKAAEKLFQTVNGIIRMQLETDERANGGEGPRTGPSAAILTAIARGPERRCAGADETPAWETETSGAKVLPDAAHLRMASGTVLRIVGLRPIGDPSRAAVARRGIEAILAGRKARCSWPARAAEQGDPMAITAEGHPIASCEVWDEPDQPCRAERCQLQVRAVSAGYGRTEEGAWRKRSPRAARGYEILIRLEARARRTGAGIWTRDE